MSLVAFRYTSFHEQAWVFFNAKHHGAIIKSLRKGFPAGKNTFTEINGEFDMDEIESFTRLSDRLGSNTWQVSFQNALSDHQQEAVLKVLREGVPEDLVRLSEGLMMGNSSTKIWLA